MRRDVIRVYKLSNTYSDNIFFPAVVVAGIYKKIIKCGRSTGSKIDKATKKLYVPPVFIRYKEPLLTHLKKYGIPPTKCKYQIRKGKKIDVFVGTCAEDNVANQLIEIFSTSYSPLNDLTSIGFTVARRPRTGQVVPYCYVCKNIFSL